MGRHDEAEQLYFDGLEKSLSKTDICEALGTRAYKKGDYKKAVLWWIRSCVLQIDANTYIYTLPFLNLAYIAEQFGLLEKNKFLLNLADKASEHGPIRFDSKGAEMRYQIARDEMSKGSEEIKSAIIELCERYN